jgi:hypothetical protein
MLVDYPGYLGIFSNSVSVSWLLLMILAILPQWIDYVFEEYPSCSTGVYGLGEITGSMVNLWWRSVLVRRLDKHGRHRVPTQSTVNLLNGVHVEATRR